MIRRAPRYIFDRWCSRGQHHRPLEAFRQFDTPGGMRLARDCKLCEEKAARGRELARLPFDGVDIDAIHFKLGAVSPALTRRKA